MNAATVSDFQIEIECRQWQAIEVLDYRSIWVPNHFVLTPERYSVNTLPPRIVAFEKWQQYGERVVGFTANDDIYTWICTHRRNVDDRRLRATEDNLRPRVSPVDFFCQPQGERI
jgi:hypothetical protein